MLSVPSIDGLGWSKVRAVAKSLAAMAKPEQIATLALAELRAPDASHRMLGTYLLGFTRAARRDRGAEAVDEQEPPLFRATSV